MLSLTWKKIKVHAIIKHHTGLVYKKIHSLRVVYSKKKKKNQMKVPLMGDSNTIWGGGRKKKALLKIIFFSGFWVTIKIR